MGEQLLASHEGLDMELVGLVPSYCVSFLSLLLLPLVLPHFVVYLFVCPSSFSRVSYFVGASQIATVRKAHHLWYVRPSPSA
jgi:hypothetical protein